MNGTSAAGQTGGVGEVDESSLVAAAQAGDMAAMNQLLARHFAYVNNLCRRMIQDRYRAEDARQEALFQAARRIETFDGRSSFRTWLHSIARNVCLNELRSVARHRPVLVEEPPETALPRVASHRPRSHGARLPSPPNPVAERTAERLDVESALAAVSPVFHDVLVLWFLCDLSYNEIAETLGIEINTVRSRLRRGKEQLKGLIGEPDGASAMSKNQRPDVDPD
jgi:RNA polymerase sigma-70 factor, ECF subfamily